MRTISGVIGSTVACGVFAAGMGAVPSVASAEPLIPIPASGTIYRLNPESTYQQGCFPPCMCPLIELHGLRGTFKLTYTGFDGFVDKYAVDDVNWTMPRAGVEFRITGSGIYQVGSPDPATVMQHRMRLDLKVGNEPVQHFDSGWVMIGDMSRIAITVSIHGMYCWDTAIIIDASPVPENQIHPYALMAGSTFQRGCYNPCDCQLSRELPMVGTFDLVPLENTPPFTEFAVANADWRVFFHSVPEVFPVTGFGRYTIFAEFAVQHRLALDLVVGIEPRTHYDSGLVVGGSEFPRIDAVVSIRGIVCFDTVLHVIAEPVGGKVCGGIAGIPCGDGEFCKLPAGRCCCDFSGVCTPVPTGCPEVWNPVCGCGGTTYPNECEAGAARVSIAYYGECRQMCSADHECSDANEFCKFPTGECGDTTIKGLCTPTRDECPPVWAPVCGCDGITYENECQADRAGTSVDHRGGCEPVCRPTDDGFGCVQLACSLIPEEQCIPTVLHLDVQTGAITALACECMDFNRCHIEFGDASPVAVGWCPDGGACQVFGRDTDNDGIDDTFTAECVPGPIGVCCVDIADGLIAYEACVELDEPTCHAAGGMFYPVNTGCSEIQACCFLNDPSITLCEDMSPYCCIASGGVPQGPDSTCEDITCGQICGGFTGIPCDNPNEFCKFPLGTCDWADLFGTCTPVPDGCPPYWDPVCGCDGITYSSECESDMRGVSIDHRGVCDTVCRPLPDGSGCNAGLCGPVPEEGCTATVLHLDVNTGALIVAACDCVNWSACHIGIENGIPVAMGSCSTVESCEVLAFDTNGDGIDDEFTARCVPIGEIGACCEDITDGPILFESCRDSTEEACHSAGGLFHAGTSCAEVQACCFAPDFCHDMNPHCCMASGGVPQGPGSRCADIVCGEMCGGHLSVECNDPNEFCKFAEGTCDWIYPPGTCAPIPPECPQVWDPVCGCDGVTYDNECAADMAGVSLAHGGECERRCGGLGPYPPCEPGEFCKFPIGVCAPIVTGVCTPIPTECPDVYEPVCSCGGVTHANECHADAAGVMITHRGECEPTCCDPYTAPPCIEGPYCCANGRWACGDGGGGSSCEALGEVCSEVCGGIAGVPCEEGLFCKLDVGRCCCDHQGVCVPIPDECPDLWDPVCGCDGVTYSNRCEADAVLVSLDHLGVCELVCEPTGDGSSCILGSCGPSMEVGCVSTVLHLDVQTGAFAVVACECLGLFDCHIGLQNGRPVATGGCPDDSTCEVIATDTNGDGVNDEFTARCVPVSGYGACCLMSLGTPLPLPHCVEVTEEICVNADGIFLGIGTTCEPTQACCLPLGNESHCVDVNPLCCDSFGGISRSRGLSCADEPCGEVCGGIAGIPCNAADEFCKFPTGTCGMHDIFGICTPIPVGCPDAMRDPVCGCDGVTYDNECESDLVGVSIDHRGECGQMCGAFSHLLPCPEDQFCKYPEGTCGAHYVVGVCTPIPGDCYQVYAPVCGCDGVTYGNECFAEAASASVAHRGECAWVCCDPNSAPTCEDGPYCCADGNWRCGDPTGNYPCDAPGVVCHPVCGGPEGILCEESRTFCKFPVGICGKFDVFGMCTPMPQGCPEYLDPVCGCNGVTYDNPCEADAAGVSIAHWGACEPQHCWSNDMCRPDQYCFFHDCAAETGVCMPRPESCPEIWDPVCGCDGVTYPNACEAARAGMSVDYPGECERTCSRIDPYQPCHPDEFCKFPPGTCGDPAVLGVCKLIPEACPEVYDPVCGCDGVTYDNECFADMARVPVDYFGECEGPPCAATRDLSSPGLSYCPGVPKSVQIHLNPSGATTFSLYDSPPDGWIVTFISNDGEFDSASWEVRWGPFTVPDIPRSVSYVVVPPDNASGVACFSGEISVEGINQPICGDECIDSLCCPFMAVDLPQPPCQACPFGDCTGCSNPACHDGRITLCELIGYACAWKRGCHDDMAGLTRAAYIWLHGECYCWDDVDDNWFPTRYPPPTSGCCRETNPGASSGGPVGSRLTDAGHTVAHVDYTRDGRKGTGRELEIPITVEAPEGTSAMSLDFQIPDGWEVTAISDEGQWDEIHRKVKWGPFSEELSRTVTLTVRRVADGRRLTARGRKGSVLPRGISGMVSFDGVNYPIAVGR